ncbi:MAG: hypothetical protein KGO02_24440 [Alphaproteobacteria bacterium]|nr:hypothetical protein [Alphaproteobacteria bacterium]
MTDLALDASGRRHAFFTQDGVDQLVSISLELAAELWTVRERLYVLESVMAKEGMPVRDKIEAYQLSESERGELAEMRSRMLNEIFRTLGREHRPARDAHSEVDR